MNTIVGFNNATNYGVSNKQNIRFCGHKNNIDIIYRNGRTLEGKYLGSKGVTTPRQDYNLVRRVVSLVRRQNPNARPKKVNTALETNKWKTIHSGLEQPSQLLAPDVKVGTQHVSATKHSHGSKPSSVTIRLYEKLSPKKVRETNYTLSPEDTSPKSVARLNELFA